MANSFIVVGANGRMGRTLCDLIVENENFDLVGATDSSERVAELSLRMVGKCPVSDSLEEIVKRVPQDTVIIDFTAPLVSLKSAEIASSAKLPIVIGTTGFSQEQLNTLQSLAKTNKVFWSSNMSIGVNAIRKILPQLVQTLGPDYDVEIVEMHHKHKKDSPSGTALTLGQTVAEAKNWDLQSVRRSSRDGIIGERKKEEIGIQALRGGDVVGIHTVYFLGPGERVEITHHAHSRENFARGALRAACWIKDQKPGKLYSVADMLA